MFIILHYFIIFSSLKDVSYLVYFFLNPCRNIFCIIKKFLKVSKFSAEPCSMQDKKQILSSVTNVPVAQYTKHRMSKDNTFVARTSTQNCLLLHSSMFGLQHEQSKMLFNGIYTQGVS